MTPARRRYVTTAAFTIALLIFAFRPVERADAWAAALCGWLSRPYQLLARAENWVFGLGWTPDPATAMAAEESALDLRRRELAGAVAKRDDLKIRPGVAANVVSHRAAEDLFEIDRGLRDGVALGDPVTLGDFFVGIVAEAHASRATVRYLWHPAARMCVKPAGDSNGRGVASGAGEGLLRLEVSDPRRVREGESFVINRSPDGDAADIAEGFLAGILRNAGDGRKPWIEPPAIVRLQRFLHVIVRTRAASGAADGGDGAAAWKNIQLSPAGDAAAGRRTALADFGAHVTIRNGAAVAVAGWLAGRVCRSGGGSARVRFIDDIGFTTEAVLLPDDGDPISLGPIQTIGAAGGGIMFRAEDFRLTLAPGESGTLLTGAADPAVPKGLRIGTAREEGGKLIVTETIAGRGARAAAAAGFE